MDFKEYLKSIIIEQEKIAKEIFVIDSKMDIQQIVKDFHTLEDKKKLLIEYFSSAMRKYNYTDNFYKRAYESYLFLYENYNNKLVDNDRIDFIATTLDSYSKDIPSNPSEERMLKQLLEEIKDFKNIVLETKLLKLKSDLSHSSINKLTEIIESNSKNEKFITLKDLFNKPDEYDKIIDEFIKHEIIVPEGDYYTLLKPKEDSSLSLKRFACAIGFYLQYRGYIKQYITDVDIVEGLNNTFKNSFEKILAKQDYNNFKSATTQQRYFKPLFFIN